MTYDLLVRGGTVVTPTAADTLDVAVAGEQIAAIDRARLARDGGGNASSTRRGCLVIPGGVDPHVHYALELRARPRPSRRSTRSRRRYGGTTTVIDFAFQEPPTTLQRRDRREEGASRTGGWRSTTASTRSSPATSRSR